MVYSIQTVAQKQFALCYGTIVLSCLFVTLVYCGQTIGWIQMKLGTQVGLGQGQIVLDEDRAPPWKGAQQPPHFRSLWAQVLPAHI